MDSCCIKKIIYLLILFISLYTLETRMACAKNPLQINAYDDHTKNQWLVGIGGGVINRSLSSSTKISNGTAVPAPYNYDIFSINTSGHEGAFTLFGGFQWNHACPFIPYYNVTLHFEHQFEATITGTIQQYALPEFTNYNYSMNLDSDIVSINGKMGLIKYKFLIPYFSAGVGIAFNYVNSYSELPIAPVSPARISPQYGSHTNTHFAYTLGAGVDFIICENIWASLAYEYWDLGNVSSGSGAGLWSSTHLSLGSLKSNTLLAMVTYYLK